MYGTVDDWAGEESFSVKVAVTVAFRLETHTRSVPRREMSPSQPTTFALAWKLHGGVRRFRFLRF